MNCFPAKPDQPSKVVKESWFKPIKICKRIFSSLWNHITSSKYHWVIWAQKDTCTTNMNRATEIARNIPGNISALTWPSEDKTWCGFKRFGSGCNRERFINRQISETTNHKFRIRWRNCLVFWKCLLIVKYQTMQQDLKAILRSNSRIRRST